MVVMVLMSLFQMLTPKQLHEYQKECILHMLYNPNAMLWLQMGLGKTIITLTAIVDLMRAGKVRKTIIFGPLRVIESVWETEAKKWEHTKHLKFSILRGVPSKRTRALFRNADIFLVNYELMNWFVQMLEHYYPDKDLPFDCVVYDEVSKLKSSTSLRVAGGNRDRKDKQGNMHKIKYLGLRKVIDKFKYRYGLTGTPAPNGYMDLHGQFLAVDGGERLGKYVSHYRDAYFKQGHNGWGYYVASDYHKSCIEAKISGITKKMDAKDYLDVPEVKVTNIMVELPHKVREKYKEIEKEMFTELDSGTEIEVFNAASKSNKCLQMVNGNVYTNTETREWEALHDVKLEALEDVLEEAAGSPVLCSYSFKSDAERIMRYFKKYKPVNLTAEKSNKTTTIINKWNRGEIKLMVGHAACLHPSTQLLTERRGWIKLIDVKKSDRVFDGIEFVSHDGCSYSGYKDVINTFGMTMTPDHKLLIDGKWEQAQNVRTCEDTRRKALYEYQGNEEYLIEMLEMQKSGSNSLSKHDKTQQVKKGLLSTLCNRSLPLQNRNSNLENLEGNETSIQRSFGQKLCRSWNRNVQRMGRFQIILQRYARRVLRQFNNRKNRREQRVLERQLHLDNNVQTTREQTDESTFNLSRGGSTFSRSMSSIWCQQDDVNHATEQRNECRRSNRRCKELRLQEKSETSEHTSTGKTHVYDLVNCGPRHRFVIKNDDGDVFISHNSMGHGIDGLQKSGSIVVWFGLNWSLELYDQMNGRLNRQGQTKPVSIIRILCKNTVDLAVLDAIDRKTEDQEGLKAALDRYRGKKPVVSFI